MRFVRDRRPKSGNCFVIMPFGTKKLADGSEFNWDDHWKNVLEYTIKEAGMEPVRADEIFGSKPLMDRIWNGIQEAEIVVADLTGRSPNVLYELGLAHVIGKRILLLTMDPGDIPADLAQLVQLRYSIAGAELLKFTRELKRNLEAAREDPAEEVVFSPMPGGGTEQIPARVLTVSPEFAIVKAQDGRKSILNAEDFSWTRRRIDLTKLIQEGDEVDGAFVVDVKGEPKYSLTATMENPWPQLEQEFEDNRTFHGTIKAHPPGIGAFVAIRHGIDGLIPEHTIPSGETLSIGTAIEASVVRIEPAKREVEIRLIRVSRVSRKGPPSDWGPYSVGDRYVGKIARQVVEKGYILVTLPDGFTALLPVVKMSPEMWKLADSGQLQDGSSIGVELVSVNEQQQKLTLRDVPQPAEPTAHDEKTEADTLPDQAGDG